MLEHCYMEAMDFMLKRLRQKLPKALYWRTSLNSGGLVKSRRIRGSAFPWIWYNSTHSAMHGCLIPIRKTSVPKQDGERKSDVILCSLCQLADHKPCRGAEATYEACIAAYPACHWNTQECWRVATVCRLVVLWLKIWLPLLVIVIIARLGHGIHVRNAHALITNVCITK